MRGIWFAATVGSCVLAAACGSSTRTTGHSSPASQPARLGAFSGGPTGFQTERASAKTGVSGGEILGLLAGIPQSGSRLGRASAPVTVTLYGDLECAICRDFLLGNGFTKLVRHDVRSGTVKVIYRAFRTASPSFSVFVSQQVAALAAGEQARFWQFAMIFLQNQGAEGTNYVTESYLDTVARQIPGLDFKAWQQARSKPVLNAQVRSEQGTANQFGIIATPTLLSVAPTAERLLSAHHPDTRGSSAASKLSPRPARCSLRSSTSSLMRDRARHAASLLLLARRSALPHGCWAARFVALGKAALRSVGSSLAI